MSEQRKSAAVSNIVTTKRVYNGTGGNKGITLGRKIKD